VCVNDRILYGLHRHLMDTTVSALETEFVVTNIAQLHLVVGIDNFFNRALIEL
jgi:hypothetical protein